MRKFGIIALLSFCLIVPAMAQQVVKDQVFVFDDFSKGLNTKLSPFSLPKEQGVTADNVRFNTELKSLSKREQTIVYGTADTVEPILGMHRLYLSTGEKILIVNHGDEVEKGDDSTGVFTNILNLSTSDHRWQWLTWRDIAIGCDGYNPCVKYDGISDSATYLGSLLATDAGSGSGPSGSYTYKVTFYTASYESSFDTASNTVTATGDVTLTMIPLGPDTFLGEDVLGRKVYRTAAGGSSYSLLSNGDIADNFTTTLTDSDADSALGEGLSADFTNAPPKGKLNLVHRNRVWIANNPDFPSRLFYSEDDSYDYFLNTEYFNIRPDDGDEITFIKTMLGILTVGKTNTIQKVYTDTGDIPSTDWSISDPFSYIGCHAPYSAVNSIIGIIYLSSNGIYSFNGQYSELVSDAVTPVIQDINRLNFQDSWGEYFKNSYFLSYPSTADDDGFNNRVLVLDMISNAYSIDLMNVSAIKTFKSGTDIERLYFGASDSGAVTTSASNTAELVHKTHDDFSGTFDDMRYIPVRSGGVASSPVLELAWDLTIDQMVGTIDSVSGIIDRPDTDGSYTSPFLTVSASAFDKIYWNEALNGGDVTFALRTGTTTPDTAAAAWSSEFTNPAGSDISGIAANNILQYRISATTDTITRTPTLFKLNNYVVKLSYVTSEDSAESRIQIRWESGWLDMGLPGYKKTLRKIYVFYESESAGTLNVKMTTLEGDSDTFSIDLATYPSAYREYFTTGALTGEFIRLDIWEDSINPIRIKQIQLVFDGEPII